MLKVFGEGGKLLKYIRFLFLVCLVAEMFKLVFKQIWSESMRLFHKQPVQRNQQLRNLLHEHHVLLTATYVY